MTILAITVYAGSKKLVQMTEDMLQVFQRIRGTIDEKIDLVAVNNGAARQIDSGLADLHTTNDENVGFGKAINRTIAVSLGNGEKWTDVLILNNDLEFQHEDWLRHLVAARDGKRVVAPCTDRTASRVSVSAGPINKDPFLANHVSAYCWLVPRRVISLFRGRFRYELFDPDFFAYGEDDLACAIMRKHIDPKPFIVVPRSWVKHLKAQTGTEMGLRGGMPENVSLLKTKMRRLGLR